MALTIRSPQLRALGLPAAQSLIPKLCEHVRKQHTGRTPASETVESFVERAVDAAADYNLFSERDLARFVDMAMLRGLPLPANLDKILRSRQPAAPNDRLLRAWRRLLFELEAEA